ncbi:pleckstrin homology and RUN domain containing M1 isoform X2 [Rhodnius prolixus]|uniref:pleckstrin homology and RUN domain containing M1 isoform X2 n=1 Tax=Rhodnius prolixus TaxID=13249 RepID=UPI003D18CA35
MKSLFRSLEIRRRDEIIKETITTQLMTSVKEVQLEKKLDNDCYTTSVEASNSLCTVLEAMFIHGIKETIVDRMSSIIGNPDQRPSPEFWSPVMIFTHRDIINQINKMSQITTDVGRSRAWIRLALNDSLFMSYLEAITHQNKTLVPYYKKTAYLRDVEALTTAINALQGLVSFNFTYPTNSKFLNVWSNNPLLLAGIWTPPMKDCPIPSGMDIVKSIPDETPPIPFTPPPTVHTTNYIDEEEALRIILNTPIEGSPMQSQLDLTVSASPQNNITSAVHQPAEKIDQLRLINERMCKLSEAQNSSQQIEDVRPIVQQTEEMFPKVEKIVVEIGPSTSQQEKPKETTNSTLLSYHKILDSYNPNSTPALQEPNLQEFIQSYEPSIPIDHSKSQLKTEIDDEDQEFKTMIDQLAKVMQEKGLDSQRFTCKECRQHIGITFAKARVCSLTGSYYCTECFKCSDWVIPARIIHNWDFTKYPVCNRSAAFLIEVQDYPLFDIRKLNPRLYFAIEEMAEMQKLRMKLNLLRLYLFTCHDPIRKDLQRLVWPREYLYEHVHLYSIADFLDIPTGVLADLMKKAINLSVEHVKSCQLCFQKGYICEICNETKTIYPFDIETTIRCSNCTSVFHDECKKKTQQCPKCDRIKRRKERQKLEDS